MSRLFKIFQEIRIMCFKKDSNLGLSRVIVGNVILLLLKDVESVRLRDLSIPNYHFRGSDATLTCNFDLEGERLYSVKWYKDGHEFFRYIPGDPDQKVTIFKLPGVKINPQMSDKNQVTLEDVNLSSAGQYRCEISAEAPLFNTVAQSKKMNVIVLPRSGPRISGGRSTYHVGEKVSVNCTSERSKPAAELKWTINGQPASEIALRSYPPIQHEDGLETSILGLEFEVTPSTFASPATRKNRYEISDNLVGLKDAGHSKSYGSSSSMFLSSGSSTLSLILSCSSSVSTLKSDLLTSETHHQKESVHFSYGSLFFSGASEFKGLSSGLQIFFSTLGHYLFSQFLFGSTSFSR